MKICKIGWLPTLILILSSGCAFQFSKQAPHDTPSDFEVVYNFDIGALPPEYHYAYEIRIGKDAPGEITYRLGYGDTGSSILKETFSLQPTQIDELYQAARQAGAMNQNWKTEEMPPVGGSNTSLELIADGEIYQIPSHPRTNNPEKLTALYRQIHDLVPAVVWAQFDAAREQYEQQQSNPPD